MASDDISQDLVEIALGKAEGTSFENFVHDFYAAVEGIDYVPLGGTHDGGADGFLDTIREASDRADTFIQASVRSDFNAKIKSTINRLREFGRNTKTLNYVTSQVVPHIDVVEDKLSEELQARIRIRDRKYVKSHINDNAKSKRAFRVHLSQYLAFLQDVGSRALITGATTNPNLEIFVFLRQELDRYGGDTKLVDAVVDSLILWALEGTDPDSGNLLSRASITGRIIDAIPHAQKIIADNLNPRIELLASKKNAGGREVRWHMKEDMFCLPYETRLLVEEENIHDATLRIRVQDGFAMRCRPILGDENERLIDKAAALCMRSVELTFEKEGFKFLTYLTKLDAEDEFGTISDRIDDALDEAKIGQNSVLLRETIFAVLRSAMYESTEEERLFFSKLLRTYSLLFSLNAEPKIVEYFQSMASDFYLYVGTDILVRALSERYLRKEDQMTTNLLDLLGRSGATLILSETVMQELHYHLRVTNQDFVNEYQELEPYLTYEHARQAHRILIRAYFYARIFSPRGEKPIGWADFVNQFIDFEQLSSNRGQEELRRYLCKKYDMKYEDIKEQETLVEAGDVSKLTREIIQETGKEEILAKNDATLVLSIYGKRRALGELSATSHFGFRTWWLTHENKIRRATKILVKERGAHYIMRPEFLLNYLSLSPTAADVRKTYQSIFPTLLGIKLSGRMRGDVYKELLKKARDAKRVEEARAEAMMARMSDDLKANVYKQFEEDVRDTPVL